MRFEILFQQFLHVLQNQLTILVIGETVIEHSQALVAPHTYKVRRVIETLRCGQEKAMVDSGEIPQIKDVVELGWSWREISDDSLIQLHCC